MTLIFLVTWKLHVCGGPSLKNLNIQIVWCILNNSKIAHFEKLANFRYIWTPPLSIFLVFTKSVTTFVTILSLKICHVTLQELQNVQLNPNPNPNSPPWIKPIKPACNCTHYPILVAFLVTWFSIWFYFCLWKLPMIKGLIVLETINVEAISILYIRQTVELWAHESHTCGKLFTNWKGL